MGVRVRCTRFSGRGVLSVNPFPHIYYTAAALAAIAALLAVCIKQRTYAYAATATLIAPLLLAYLIGMYRIGGVDFENYEGYLGSQRDQIPDVGYRLLMDLAAAAGLNLSEFFLLQGLFSLGAVCLLAKKFRSDLVVTLTLYLLHGAIVRDFSQSRSALALAIYFVALAQERKVLYVALTVAATSVHFSLVPLVFVYHWARTVIGLQKGQVFFTVAPAVGLIASVSVLLPLLSLIDPRIEIYLNWAEDLYGNPVGSYSGMLLLLLIAAICYRVERVTDDKDMRVFVIMIMYALAIFIAFREIAIFAFRLSNMVAVLYPFAVGRAVYLLKSVERDRLHAGVAQHGLQDLVLSLALLGGLLLAIVVRSGSLDILRDTQPALLAY